MVSSPVNTGKIISELTVPDTATPSMKAAKAIQVEYHLNILFDMREKASFLEARHSKTIKAQDRNMLLSTPGCFEIQVPIIIGTLSDSLHRPKSSPFAHPTAPYHPITPAHSTPSSSSTLTLSGSFSVSPPSLPPSPSPSPSPSTLQQYQAAVQEPPMYRISSVGPGTLPMRRHQSDLFGASAVTPPYPYRGYSHTIGPSHAPAIDHQNRPTLSQLMEKPLPDVPRRSVHLPPQPLLPLPGAPFTFAPPPEYSRPRSVTSPHGSAFNAMSTPPRLPPRPHHIPITSTERAYALPMNPNEYPLDKFTPAQLTDLPLPVNPSIAEPTAPQAVDLGLGPASPLSEHSLVTTPESSSTQGIIKNTTRLSMGYFPTVLNPSHRVSMMATPTVPATIRDSLQVHTA